MIFEPELRHGQLGVFLEGRDEHGVEDVARGRRMLVEDGFECSQWDGDLAPAMPVRAEVMFKVVCLYS